MFIIPGVIISIFTFPGVIVHEWAHKKFCEWFVVNVQTVKYFRIGNPAGYVLHDNPVTYKQTFWLSVGPLLINSLITILLGFITSQTIKDSLLYNLSFWVAISIGVHSFPSDHAYILVGSAPLIS